ncbi:DUF3179 domain-containing protein [Chloroflexota bacterium]
MKSKIRFNIGLLVMGSLLLTACATAIQAASQASPTPSVEVIEPTKPPAALPTAVSKATETPEEVVPEPVETEKAAGPTATPIPHADRPPSGAESQFDTDFSKHSVDYGDILSGGPPKDGIPAVDEPKFIPVEEADEWLNDLEPVAFIQVGALTRAYPLQILMWHEIVNDTVGDFPLVVTFCPLCNTAIVFERTLDSQVFDFGTTGRLRYSNLIMYDRQTETWWQQATGEAIAGDLTGEQLKFYPTALISWGDFKTNYADGMVLSQDTGFDRNYGLNPYSGYDNVNLSPFLYIGPATPEELPAMARVITVDLGEEAVAYPYELLQDVQVANDAVAGEEIVVIWAPGVASALDATTVSAGRDVGTANAYSRLVNGQLLTFRFEDGRIMDDLTDSEWDVFGRAVSGELEGTQLTSVVAINHFWFSWAAFKPETRIYQ